MSGAGGLPRLADGRIKGTTMDATSGPALAADLSELLPPETARLLEAGAAWHEAGHLVVAYRLGYAIGGATIRPAGIAVGSCLVQSPIGVMLRGEDGRVVGRSFASRREQLAWLRDHAAVLMAGRAAERIGLGRPSGHEHDDEALSRLVSAVLGYGPTRRVAYAERAEARASALLWSAWPLLGAAKAALMERGELQREDWAAILEEFDI
jgi:hypothetical protein